MRSYFWARRIDLVSVLLIFTSDALLSTLAMSRKKRSASVAKMALERPVVSCLKGVREYRADAVRYSP